MKKPLFLLVLLCCGLSMSSQTIEELKGEQKPLKESIATLKAKVDVLQKK